MVNVYFTLEYILHCGKYTSMHGIPINHLFVPVKLLMIRFVSLYLLFGDAELLLITRVWSDVHTKLIKHSIEIFL